MTSVDFTWFFLSTQHIRVEQIAERRHWKGSGVHSWHFFLNQKCFSEVKVWGKHMLCVDHTYNVNASVLYETEPLQSCRMFRIWLWRPGFLRACFWHLKCPLLIPRTLTLLAFRLAQRKASDYSLNKLALPKLLYVLLEGTKSETKWMKCQWWGFRNQWARPLCWGVRALTASALESLVGWTPTTPTPQASPAGSCSKLKKKNKLCHMGLKSERNSNSFKSYMHRFLEHLRSHLV